MKVVKAMTHRFSLMNMQVSSQLAAISRCPVMVIKKPRNEAGAFLTGTLVTLASRNVPDSRQQFRCDILYDLDMLLLSAYVHAVRLIRSCGMDGLSSAATARVLAP